MPAKLLEFPVVPLTDIPARLRLLAEQIEDGEFGELTAFVGTLETADTVQTVGFGEQWDPMRVYGLLHFAASQLFGGDE